MCQLLMKRQILMISLNNIAKLYQQLILLAAFVAAVPGFAVQAQDAVLDDYVAEGISNNLALQQRSIDLRKSLESMVEARGMFFPEVSLQARYSRAGGGRQIAFPVGDLLNPVYGTLNDLLVSQGQPPSFPQLDNIEIAFLREREQETKVRIIQPVFQPAVLHNYRLQQHLATSQEAAVAAYRQVLVRDIKIAYYTYLKADRALKVFDDARNLVDENLRVSQRLFDHDKVTEDTVFRARAEMLSVSQMQQEALKDRALAQSYFNFLLNRPFDEEIEAIPEHVMLAAVNARPGQLIPVVLAEPSDEPADAMTSHALHQRAELKQLAAAYQASKSALALSKSTLLPGVSLAVDLGLQGTTYGLGNDNSFYMASLVLDWKLFRGGQSRSRLNQAKLETQKLGVQQDELHRQIALQVQEASDNYEVAYASLRTAQERLHASREGYRMVSRKYDEGMSNQVAFLDARATLTEAELNLNITYYDVLIRQAELAYAAGLNL